MKNKSESSSESKSKPISLAPLTFEDALENLLKVKPIENEDLKKDTPKKKSKPKTKE